MTYKTRETVWQYPGMAGWHFIYVNKKASEEIKEKYGKNRRGFGSVPVEATIGKTTWKTSIFPDKKFGQYLLPLKAKVREQENIIDGKTVAFSVTIRR